jgi:hypothetical protein
MQKIRKTFINESRFRVLFCLAVLGFLAALIVLPDQFRSNANKKEKNIEKAETSQEKIENYDMKTTIFVQISGRLRKSPGFARRRVKPRRKLPTRVKNSCTQKKS